MSVEEVLLNPREEKIKELDKLIKISEIDLRYIEDFVFRSNDARLVYLCGKHIEWINKGRVAHALTRMLDSYYILQYAHYIEQAKELSIEEHKKIIAELGKGMARCKSPFRIYYFARDILYAPIEKLAESLVKSNDGSYIFYMLRDLRDNITSETKEKLERRIIELKDSGHILSTSAISTKVSTVEYAEALLNAKKTDIYATHLCMFLSEHEIEDKKLKNRFIENIVQTKDYRRIIDLMKNSEQFPFMEVLDYILEQNNNYQNSNFWLNYIIPLATSVLPCASYAVEKIIESMNVEIITIAIYYIKNEELREKLQNALNNIPSLDDEYKKTKLKSEVISRVRSK